MRLNVEKHTLKFMWAIDRAAKSEMPKTEDEYVALAVSVLRPIFRKAIRDGGPEGGVSARHRFRKV